VSASIVQFAEGMLDQSGELIRGSVDGQVQRRRFVVHRDGLAAFEARLDQAAFVILSPLRTAFVGQVDLHPRDVIAHSAQGILDYAPDPGQRLVAFDYMVRIDLDLHSDLLLRLLIKDVPYAQTLPLRCYAPERLSV
jgi:hypothetical protein